MSLQYQLFKSEQVELGTVARVIRDDASGSLIEIASNGVIARVKIADIISEINAAEKAKLASETPQSEAVKNEER